MLANLSRLSPIASIALALAAIPGFEARAQMSAPLVGLIGAETPSLKEIRPVLGVLGASSIRPPIQLSREISGIYLAPTGGWALVVQRGPGRSRRGRLQWQAAWRPSRGSAWPGHFQGQ